MKILLLGDPESVHTQRWANALAKKGIRVSLFGLYEYKPDWFHPSISIFVPKSYLRIKSKPDGSLSKLLYLQNIFALRKFIKKNVPDIIHAHYASSYGLLGALSRFHPFIISVYGSDIYTFPQKNIFTKNLIKFNLLMADRLLSTSNVMVGETRKYTKKHIVVTPFGIDINVFYPFYSKELLFDKNDIIIGTVKTLEDKYGIEYLIRAFKIVKNKYPYLPLKLLLVGKGTKEFKLKKIVYELDLADATKFTGFIDYDEIPKYHNMLDISVFVSIDDSESFGVSVLEAMACGKPVIVSNAGGLPEVVEKDVTGLIVGKENVVQTANAIEKLLLDKAMRLKFGVNGRERVKIKYSLDDSISQMIKIYESTVTKELSHEST